MTAPFQDNPAARTHSHHSGQETSTLTRLPMFHSVSLVTTTEDQPSPTLIAGSPPAVGGAWGVAPSPMTVADTAVDQGPGDPIDWRLVATVRVEASDRLTEALAHRSQALSPAGQRELGRGIILELLDIHARRSLTSGSSPLSPAAQRRTAQAVFDALFGLGRLQPLVDDDAVENIEVNGFDNVTLQLSDGSRRPGPAVADSDEELLEFLSFLASRGEGDSRPFSPARPTLHLTLDGGARLAATAWITPRPVVVVRRHRLRVVRLHDLVQRGVLSELAASFLSAAVRSGRSIVVSGPQGAGKTTLIRALASELPAWERIGTFETEYELFLHEMPGRFASVTAWQARPGSGERSPDGRQAGEITLDDCLYDSFRFNLDRQIVGEVRGREVLAMFKAMQSGAGSLSTTHAANAAGAVQKLITCALEAGPQVTVAYAERVVAEHVDLIVQLAMQTSTDPVTGQPLRRRWVSEIVAIHHGEAGPAHTDVFRARLDSAPGTARLVPGVLPEDYRALRDHGFDLEGYLLERDLDGDR